MLQLEQLNVTILHRNSVYYILCSVFEAVGHCVHVLLAQSNAGYDVW